MFYGLLLLKWYYYTVSFYEMSSFLQVVKDHGPFIDFELLRNRHAHCSVFLSFLISNADPAPMVSLSSMSSITLYMTA